MCSETVFAKQLLLFKWSLAEQLSAQRINMWVPGN